MIQWPSILPAGPGGATLEPVGLPIDGTPDARGFGIDFPQLAPIGESAKEDSLEVAAHGEAGAAGPARSHWSAAALTASVIFHAVAIAGFGVLVAHEGLEAQTDAISVEIVLESAPQTAAEASVAGDANETRDAAAPADAPEPGTRTTDRPLDTPQAALEQTVMPRSFESAAAVLPPGFEPLPPLTDIGAAREKVATAAPAEPTSEPKMDVAATLPVFSPLPPLAGTPVATAPPEEAAEAHDAPEPVLAARPSLESMLPAIVVPEQPLFPPAAEANPVASVPSEKPEAAAPARRTAEKPAASIKPDKAREPRKARKTETRSAAAVRVEKPAKPKVEAGASPPGGAKAKGKSQEATRAGSVASAAASSGDKEAYGRKVNRHVQRYKRYPDAAARGGMKGAVKVSISIGGSGNLASARVTGSSGYPVLDGEALATVRRAAPYPEPPAGFGGTARFSLTLTYRK